MIESFTVDPLTEWSDHCSLSFNILCKRKIIVNDNYTEILKTRWNDDKKNAFRREIFGKLPALNVIVSNCENIDNYIEQFTEIINDAALPLFQKE